LRKYSWQQPKIVALATFRGQFLHDP